MVVLVVWVCLTFSAEVGVVADGTLIANTLDVVVLVLAERTVAVDTYVAWLAHARYGKRLEEGREAMPWVDQGGVLDALRAVVPVRALEALVADAEDWLVSR